MDEDTPPPLSLVGPACSHRRRRFGHRAPLVVVDCGAPPPTLLESELFEHVRGAFTGADTARVGALESADGGTVFLDEIGELPLALQSRLLRVIEQRQIRRLGATGYTTIDVRFVSATRRDLPHMIIEGQFREDLWYPISPLVVPVPPLRDHSEDIPTLVEHWVRRPVDRDALAPLSGRSRSASTRTSRSFPRWPPSSARAVPLQRRES